MRQILTHFLADIGDVIFYNKEAETGTVSASLLK